MMVVRTTRLSHLHSLRSSSKWPRFIKLSSPPSLTAIKSSRVEILNEGGFRSDGRKQFELRDMVIDLAQQSTADGSASLSHGLTQVQVSVFGPREAKMRSQTMYDRANVNVELSIASFSTGERRKRSRNDK